MFWFTGQCSNSESFLHNEHVDCISGNVPVRIENLVELTIVIVQAQVHSASQAFISFSWFRSSLAFTEEWLESLEMELTSCHAELPYNTL